MSEFTTAFKPHYNDLLRYCRSLCSRWPTEEAEDVLQKTLILGLKKFDQLRDPDKIRPWLFQIATRVFYSAVRSHFWKRFVSLENNPEAEKIPNVYSMEKHSEDKQILYYALSKISSKDKAAILLFEIAGFSVAEVGKIQGDRSLSATKSRLSRARNKLRTVICESENSYEKYDENVKTIEQETIGLMEKAGSITRDRKEICRNGTT